MINALRPRWKGAQAFVWAVAYALVIQLVLTSSVLAGRSFSPASDSYQFCLNDPASSAEHDSGGDEGKAFVHCPLCLSRVDAALLPTPVETGAAERCATPVRFAAPNPASAPPPCPPAAYRPRGPPGPA